MNPLGVAPRGIESLSRMSALLFRGIGAEELPDEWSSLILISELNGSGNSLTDRGLFDLSR